MTKEDIAGATEEFAYIKACNPGKAYWHALLTPTPMEKDTVDLQKPFALFNGSIQVGLTERINVLERETVRIYQKKLNAQSGLIESIANLEKVQKEDVTAIMENDKVRLEEEAEGLKENIDRLNNDWEADKVMRDAHLHQTVHMYEERLAKMQRDAEHLKDVFLKEILIKDRIIENEEGIKEKWKRLAKELNMKLKIPRHHLEFLKAKGALDHFVSAKLTGDDISAKWLLLQAGKPEISGIVREHEKHEREDARAAARRKKLKMYGLLEKAGSVDEASRAQSQTARESKLGHENSLATQNQSQYSMTGTTDNDKLIKTSRGEAPSPLSSKPVFDINLHEVLKVDLTKLQGPKKLSSNDLASKRQLSNREVDRQNSIQYNFTMGTVQSSHRALHDSKKVSHPLHMHMEQTEKQLTKLDIRPGQGFNISSAQMREENPEKSDGKLPVPAPPGSTLNLQNVKDSPRVLEKYKVRQEVTLDESVEEFCSNSSSGHSSGGLTDDSQIKQSKYETQQTEFSVKQRESQKQNDIQILEANTLSKKKKSRAKNNKFENSSPSKLSQKAHLKYQKFTNAKNSCDAKNTVSNDERSHENHLQKAQEGKSPDASGFLGPNLQNDSLLDATVAQDSATTFSNEKLQNIAKMQAGSQETFDRVAFNEGVSLNFQNFDYAGPLGLARKQSFEDALYNTDIKIKNKNPFVQSKEQLKNQGNSPEAAADRSAFTNAFASAQEPLVSNREKIKDSQQKLRKMQSYQQKLKKGKLAKTTSKDAADTLLTGVQGSTDASRQALHLDLMRKLPKTNNAHLSQNEKGAGGTTTRTSNQKQSHFESKWDAGDAEMENEPRHVQVTAQNVEREHLDAEMADRGDGSSNDEMTLSTDYFIKGALLRKEARASNLSPKLPIQLTYRGADGADGHAFGTVRGVLAKPVSTRDYLQSEQAEGRPGEAEAQRIYAVPNSRSKKPWKQPHHGNSDIQDLLPNLANQSSQGYTSSKPAQLKPMAHTAMERGPEHKIGTSSALSPLREADTGRGQSRTARDVTSQDQDQASRMNLTRSRLNPIAKGSAGNIAAANTVNKFLKTEDKIFNKKSAIGQARQDGAVKRTLRQSFDAAQGINDRMNPFSSSCNQSFTRPKGQFLSPQSTSVGFGFTNTDLKELSHTHRQNQSSHDPFNRKIQEERIQNLVQHSQKHPARPQDAHQQTMVNFMNRFPPATSKKKMPQTSHTNRQKQVKNALKGQGILKNQKNLQFRRKGAGTRAPKIEVDIWNDPHGSRADGDRSPYFQTKQTSENREQVDQDHDDSRAYGDEAASDLDNLERPDLTVMGATFYSKYMGSKFSNVPAQNQAEKLFANGGGRVPGSDQVSMNTGNNLTCASPTSFRQQILKKESTMMKAKKNFDAYRLIGIQDNFKLPEEPVSPESRDADQKELGKNDINPQIQKTEITKLVLPMNSNAKNRNAQIQMPPKTGPISKEENASTRRSASNTIDEETAPDRNTASNQSKSRHSNHVNLTQQTKRPPKQDDMIQQNDGMSKLYRKEDVKMGGHYRNPMTGNLPSGPNQTHYASFANFARPQHQQSNVITRYAKGGDESKTNSVATSRLGTERGVKKMNSDLMEMGEMVGDTSVGEAIGKEAQEIQEGQVVSKLKQVSQQKARMVAAAGNRPNL